MSLLSDTPAEGVKITEDDLTAIGEICGYDFQGNEKAEYATLIGATVNAMQFVLEMEVTVKRLVSNCQC